MAGAGEKGCAPRLGLCTIKVTSDGSSSNEQRQLPPLLLPPTALSRQKESKQSQALRMKFQALKVAALLLVLLCSAPTPSEALGGWASTLKRQSGTEGPGEDPPPGDGRDNLLGQNSKESHHSAGAWKVMEEAPTSKAMAKPQLSRDKQKPLGKSRSRPLQPFHSRSMGLRHHLKGYGKFNEDTHSCHSIQSRPCKKPSDCSGCLGLYTCKLPTSTCDLKAVSRQRGGFFQSIQHPEGRRVLLIP